MHIIIIFVMDIVNMTNIIEIYKNPFSITLIINISFYVYRYYTQSSSIFKWS